MGCKIVFAPQAIDDLAAVVARIAKEDPTAAQRIGNALLDRVTILESFPLIGSTVPDRPQIRKLIAMPYLIFYRPRVDDGYVDILRYWHGARGNRPEFTD